MENWFSFGGDLPSHFRSRKGKKHDVPLPEMSKLAGRSGRSRFARNWFGHASTAAGRHRL